MSVRLHEARVIPGGKAERVELRALDRERITFRYLASRAPVDVVVSAKRRPRIVWSEAVNRATLAAESPVRLTWVWLRGAMRVTAADVSDTSVEYDVTVELEA